MFTEVSRATIQELLEYFISSGLGLTLEARIWDACDLPEDHRGCLSAPKIIPRVWAAWYTDVGPVTACAAYDYEQASRVGAHVLFIEWWVTSREHHESWWHCYPRRPRDWIKGSGTTEYLPPT